MNHISLLSSIQKLNKLVYVRQVKTELTVSQIQVNNKDINARLCHFSFSNIILNRCIVIQNTHIL